MDDLMLYRTFVRVVTSGSISAAAREMGVSVAAAARSLKRLESGLGVRLLNRTTRHQSLTEAGDFYYSQLTAILDHIDGINKEVSAYQSEVKGSLRVHLRTFIGSEVIVPALRGFLEKHPELTIELTLTDERASLVAEGIDVAVWFGSLEDSTLVARRLGDGHRVVCASREYLDRRGYPKSPTELKNHNCLVYRANRYGSTWRFTRGEETIVVPVSGNLVTENVAALYAAAMSGLGLILIQEVMVREAIKSGRLVPVLTDYEGSPTETSVSFYAIYPQSRHVSPKTRAFVDFVVDLLKKKD